MIGEDQTEAYQPDAAFLAGLADGNVLFGEPLAKFSLSRKIAAQAMGCQAPASFTPEAYAVFKRTLQYPGVHNDVIIILWLCTLPDKITTAAEVREGKFTPDRAINRPAEAVAKAREWAESVQLGDMLGAQFEEAWKMFLHLVFGVDMSAFDLAVGDGGESLPPPDDPKETPGPRTSPRSSRTQRKNPGTPQRSSGTK